MFGKPFTIEEDNYLKANCLTIPTKRMSKNLGRSESSARQRLQLLGVVIPQDVRDKFRLSSQIKAGDEPFNKGRKQSEYMSKEGLEAIKATQFKPGSLPHNTRQSNGEISVRRDNKSGIDYLYIRVDIAKWVLYQRYQYEKFIGEIPDGYIVALKDGDTFNGCPTNLELISREENMRRNTIYRYPPELVKTIKKLARLKKTIKNYGKK